MFSAPEYGWVNITLGDFTSRASYLTDIPLDLLNALISAYKHGTMPAVDFDAEGWGFTAVASMYSQKVYIILDKEEVPELFTVDMAMKEFADEVNEDITTYLHEWTLFTWNDYDVSDTEEYSLRRAEIWSKLCELKNLMRKGEQ